MSPIKISESLQFYFENEKHAEAMQKIIESRTLPRDFNLFQIEQYHKAKVSTQITQLDYWLFMKDLWGVTWGNSLKCNKEFEEVEMVKYAKDAFSLKNTWEDTFYKAYKFKEKYIQFKCYATDEDVYLRFFIESPNGKYGISNEMILSDKWKKNHVDYDRETQQGIVDIKGKSEIEIEPLINLAQKVVSKISKEI